MPSKKKKYNARFPPARIKKIMQTDEDVGKVAAAVPVIISRALELFIESLITKTSEMTKARNAKTLSTQHIKHTILSEKEFDFLKELVENIPDVQAPEEESSERSQPVERPPGSRPRGRPRKKPEDALPPKKRRVKIQAPESSDDSETEDADSEIGENSDDTSSSSHSAMTSAAATSVISPAATISPLAAGTTQSQLLGPPAAGSAPTSGLPDELTRKHPSLPFTAPVQNVPAASTTIGLPPYTTTSTDIAMPLDMSVTATSKSIQQTAGGLGQTADTVGNNTHPSITTGAHMPRTLPAPMMSAPVIGEMPRFHPSLPFPPLGYGASLPPHAHGPLAMPPMTGVSGMPVLPHHMYPPYMPMHNSFLPPGPIPGMHRYPPVCTVASPVPTSTVTTAAASAAAGKADDDYDS